MEQVTQQRAPLLEAMQAHRLNRVVRFDVPGHKGGRGNHELAEFLGADCVRMDVNSMKNLDFSGRVRGMRCPVLIICGEKDRSNIRSAQYLSQNIPGAELQLIEHTGHVVNEENPKALAERLNKFYSLHP